MWFVAQLVEHFTVNEAVAGSNPAVPPKQRGSRLSAVGRTGNIFVRLPLLPTANFPGAVAERRMHFAVYEDDDGSSPFGPATYYSSAFRVPSSGLKTRNSELRTRNIFLDV